MLSTLNLFDQCIFDSTSVLVKKSRSFSTEVLKNFQGLVRDLAQVRITCACACGCRLYGLLLCLQGLVLCRLLGRISWG